MKNITIIAGSNKDKPHVDKIIKHLDKFRIKGKAEFASAHKTPVKLIEIIKENDKNSELFITVAGRSDALSGFVSFNTLIPVIACPPYDIDNIPLSIISTLASPTGSSHMTVVGTQNAALACAEIIAKKDDSVLDAVKSFKAEQKEKLGKKESKEI